jgi:hypothetical protein
MVGVKGRSGRPVGSRRWSLLALAGMHFNTLTDLWLGGCADPG